MDATELGLGVGRERPQGQASRRAAATSPLGAGSQEPTRVGSGKPGGRSLSDWVGSGTRCGGGASRGGASRGRGMRVLVRGGAFRGGTWGGAWGGA